MPRLVPRSSATPYQNAIASSVQMIADKKNSLGRGKNETNMDVLGQLEASTGVLQAKIMGPRSNAKRTGRTSQSKSGEASDGRDRDDIWRANTARRKSEAF